MIAIAIDGPAGAGKSTIAQAVAKRLGFIHVDTGALYRTIGLYMIQNGIPLDNPNAISKILDNLKIDISYKNGEQRMLLCGDDVSDSIRTPEVSMAASTVSAVPEVRVALLDLQKSFAAMNNVVMDGRDIGTVVLPNAQIKIFLTASPDERANRRCLELEQKGIPANYNDVFEDLIQRDYQDSHRKIAPLKAAEDSIVLDTSEFTLQQSIDAALEIIDKKMTE